MGPRQNYARWSVWDKQTARAAQPRKKALQKCSTNIQTPSFLTVDNSSCVFLHRPLETLPVDTFLGLSLRKQPRNVTSHTAISFTPTHDTIYIDVTHKKRQTPQQINTKSTQNTQTTPRRCRGSPRWSSSSCASGA